MQALHLAAVLVLPRRLMVPDEPEHLDPAARRWRAGVLCAEKRAGAAVLIATRHAELAASVADHVVVLSDGAIISQWTADVALAAMRWLSPATRSSSRTGRGGARAPGRRPHRTGRPRQASVACAGRLRACSWLPGRRWLCEGARLDADDPRRSVHLPFRFKSLARWHAAVPCLILLAAAGVPAAVLALAAGAARLLVLLVVTVPVLVGGALVNAFRGQFPPDLFAGVDTPFGNTAAARIVFWFASGPVLAVAPMTALLPSAIGSPDPGALVRAVVIGAGLAGGLGACAARRAARVRSA